jgi:sulfatase maturation enzyme AslB (radical SAM superfamily)
MTYCPLPFRHVFVEPRGVKPCCSFTEIHDVSVSEWVASDRLKKLQATIAQGEIDPGCRDCIKNEIRNGTSTRLGALKDYGTDPDYNTNIDYVDYRGSNICNFKCRSCEPYYSNGIAQDVRRSTFLQTIHSVPPEKVARADNPQWIIDNLNRIKRLMFTGGEPTIMPGVREIIQQVQQQKTDTQVIMITNGSFRDSYWPDIAKSMHNVNFTVSIDAVGTAAEIIRHGSNWSTVESNIRYLAQHAHSLNFSTVITRLNLFQLAPLLKFTKSLRDDYDQPNGRTQFIQICNHPDFLSPINLPTELQSLAVSYLESILEWEDHEPTRDVISNLLQAIKTHVYDPDLWEKGSRYNDILDTIRNEAHSWLYEPAH